MDADIAQAHSSNKLWPLFKRFRGNRRRTATPLHGPRGLLYDATDKAEALADHLEDIFTPHLAEDNALRWIRHVSRTMQEVPPAHDDLHILPASPSEVHRLIKRSPRKKFPGLDKVTYELLRHLPRG